MPLNTLSQLAKRCLLGELHDYLIFIKIELNTLFQNDE